MNLKSISVVIKLTLRMYLQTSVYNGENKLQRNNHKTLKRALALTLTPFEFNCSI